MKIQKLSLSNFRSHENSDLTLDRLNFVIGANGSGKSSLAMAVEFLLCGTCEVTDEGGKGAEDLIRKGESETTVTAEIDTGAAAPWNIQRTKNARGQELKLQSGGMLPLAEAQKKLSERIGVPNEVLRAVLNSSRFVDLDTNAQKKLLSQVLADQGVAVPADLQAAVGSAGPLTITELDRVYKSAYERRTGLNRDAKQLATLEAPETMDAPNVEDIKKKIAALNAERDAANKSRYQAKAKSEDSVSRRLEIESDISALNVLILPMAKERELKAIADKGKEFSTASESAAQLRGQITAKQDQIKSLVKLGMRAECPTCLRLLSKEKIGEIAQGISDQVKDLEGQLRTATSQAELFKAAGEARERIKSSITAVGEKEELERELAHLPAPGAPVDTSELDEQIAELDKRILKGQDVLVKASGLQQQIKAYKENLARKSRVDDELAIVERVLAFAGPDGARKEAAGGKLESFCDSMNAVLEQFGYSANIVLNPFSLEVAGADESGKKPLFLHQLCESEKFRFSIAFQIALAKITGIGLVVIDKADQLDKDSRRVLSSMLMQSGVDQALVCSTSTDPMPTNVPDGVKFFRFEQRDGITKLPEHSAKVAA